MYIYASLLLHVYIALSTANATYNVFGLHLLLIIISKYAF